MRPCRLPPAALFDPARRCASASRVRDEIGAVASVSEENAAAAEEVAASRTETAASVDLVEGAGA